MAYATVAHVEAKCLNRAPFTTKPSATQVILYLGDSAALIDLALTEAQYTVPVPMGTTTVPSTAQQFLQNMNSLGAAWYVERYAQNSDREKDYQLAFETALNMIKAVGLPGMDRTGATGLPRTNVPCASPAITLDMQL